MKYAVCVVLLAWVVVIAFGLFVVVLNSGL